MAAPEGIVWGSVVGDYGRIGIYTTISTTNTTLSFKLEVWFWSKYSVSDSNNELCFDILSSPGSASTSRGDMSIKTTADSGGGWSTSNQVKLWETSTWTLNRSASDSTRYVYAKLSDVNMVSGAMYAETTFTIPALDKYNLDVNIKVDNVLNYGGDSSVALFNLYINGETEPHIESLKDINTNLPYGTTYRVEIAYLNEGYECTSNTSFSGTIRDDVSHVFTFEQLGLCKIHNGTSSENYLAHIKDGDSYSMYFPYIHNGTSWEPYNG